MDAFSPPLCLRRGCLPLATRQAPDALRLDPFAYEGFKRQEPECNKGVFTPAGPLCHA